MNSNKKSMRVCIEYINLYIKTKPLFQNLRVPAKQAKNKQLV